CVELLLSSLAVGLIVYAESSLFLHGVALIFEILFRDVETSHAVGFQEKREVELVGGQRLIIVGPIRVGRTVHRAAVVEDENELLALADVLRTLKHHVLEEVREAGAALSLVARTGV